MLHDLRHTLSALCLGWLLLATAWAAETAAPAGDAPTAPQRPDHSTLLATLDAGGQALHEASGVLLTRADYTVPDAAGVLRQAEAIAFTPPGTGPWPALLLIPGFGTSCRDWTANGLAFAAAGYYCLAVSQPGFGASAGPADFAGPWTLSVLSAGLARLRDSPQADAQRLGLVGFSRGAMAAALLGARLPGLKAVVLGGGVYDLQRAYDDSTSQMIRRNMLAETGSLKPTDIVVDAAGQATLSPEAVLDPAAARERSAIFDMERLRASVLILHGEEDLNAPLSQAYLLRDRLAELEADFELIIFPGSAHAIGLENFQQSTLEFLGRKL